MSLLIGLLAGLRALTPAAATAWAVRLGWLPLDGPLALIGWLPVVIVLTLLAIGELIGDKLPNTPARTALPGLAERIFVGAVTGACIGRGGGGSLAFGIVLGAIGGIIGAYGGDLLRTGAVKVTKLPDIVVALVEDAVAIAGALWVVSRF
ncbi:MAG: DUF4126 family protein [Candidatus Binatia bacterium]